MSNYITLDGIRIDLDSLSESDKQKLRDGLGERPKQGVVTPWEMVRPGNQNISILEEGLRIRVRFGNDVPVFLEPTKALQLARALTVAASEKLGVVAPKAFRAAEFNGYEVDGKLALSFLDDLIQGAEQGEGV